MLEADQNVESTMTIPQSRKDTSLYLKLYDDREKPSIVQIALDESTEK